MSVENPQDSYPPLQETIRPIDRVLVASVSVIDLIGNDRSAGDVPVFDAGWRDDTLGYRFELQARRDDHLPNIHRYF